MTPTHHRPRPVDPGATAAKQQIVVQLVLLARRPGAPEHRRRRAFDRQHDRRVIWRREDVAAEAVRVGCPTKGVLLYKNDDIRDGNAVSPLVHMPATRRVKKKGRRTGFQSSPSSYHATSSVATYASLAILASSRSVSRFSRSGPTISVSHHGRSVLWACRMERMRAAS